MSKFQRPYKGCIAILSLFLFSHCNTYVNLSLNDLADGQWTELKSQNNTQAIARHEAAFIAVGDKMYLLGGRGLKPVSIYHPDANRWTQGSTPPIELHHFQPVVYEEEIWIIGAMTGGYPGETPVTDMYVYNPQDDNWRIEGSIPEERARGGAGVVVLDNHLYLICGIRDGHRGDHKAWIDKYDISRKTWFILPNAPRARDHFQAVHTKGKIYVIAGRTTIAKDNPFKHTIGQVDVFDIDNNTWTTEETDLPTWRAGNNLVVVQDEILVIGGESYTQEKTHAEVEAFNVISKKWRSLPSLPIGRHGTGTILMGDKLYTASGCGNRGGNPELSDLWVYEF